MESLLATLGRLHLLDNIVELLSAERNGVVIVAGPSGCGKSWFAKDVGSDWLMKDGVCLTAEGDITKQHREFFPLTYSLSVLHRRWITALRKNTRGLAGAAGGTLAAIASGGLVSQRLTESLLGLLHANPKEEFPFLSEAELSIIQALKRFAGKKPLLLIADDFQWWDQASKELLLLFHSDRLRSKIPTLAALRSLIIVRETEDAPKLVEQIKTASGVSAHLYHLQSCRADQFPGVLEAMGLQTKLGQEVTAKLFALSQGHLKVAEHLVAYLNNSRGSTSPTLLADDDELLRTIMSERLRFFQRDAEDTFNILKLATVLGTNFTATELSCLSGEDHPRIRAALSAGEQAGLIEKRGQRTYFSHDIVRQFLRLGAEAGEGQVLERYSECLRLLAPGEYALRSDIAEQLGEHDKAGAFAVSAALKVARGAARSARRTPESLIERIERNGLMEAYGALNEAHDAFISGRFAQGIASLDRMASSDSELIYGETEYLRCLNLMEMENDRSFSECARRLESWQGYETTEFELGMRLILLRQQVLVLWGRTADARHVEAIATRMLAPRVAYDPDAALKMNIVGRKADALYEPEIALLKVQRALDFFRGQTSSTAPIYPVEYYKALTNLCAIHVKIGDNESALAVYQTLRTFVEENPEAQFPRRDIPTNNSIIAAARTTLSRAEAADAMETLSLASDAAGENFIHRCNATGLMLLANEADRARSILDDLKERTRVRSIDESYLLYYFYSHDLCWQFHFGEKQHLDGTVNRYKAFVERLNWPSRPYILERSGLLDSAIADVRPGDVVSWDDYFLTRGRVGPAWRHYGRGVPLCEIQFWSEI